MDFLSLVYTIGAVISAAILLWFKTKSGKKWLKDL